MKTDLSQKLFARAKELFPGGVNSPVRAFRGVGGTPVFFSRGKGSRLFDVDGNSYLDYVGSWGPLIVGHCNPDAVRIAIERVRERREKASPSTRPGDRATAFDHRAGHEEEPP